MSSQRQNSAPGPSDVAEQQLQNRSGSNDLHAFGMLRPSHCIANCAVFSGPDAEVKASATFRNTSCGTPQYRSTISGV